MLAALQHLDAALAELAALDVDTLDDSELHDLVVAVHARRDRLGIIAATPLARWDGRGVWTGDGSRTAKSRLSRDCHTSVTTAGVELRRARHLATMPRTAAAVATGRLSLDHVDLLA
ncbi:MAG: 13E12 repeat family protein, partial [Actinomycetota bacterium]|nr:13E12 repeat family protein [Actinomycetota bacterium]